MTEDEVIVEGDRVRNTNPGHHCFGQVGVVVSVCWKPVWKDGGVDLAGRRRRVCVSGDPDNAGESFARVRYDNGFEGHPDLKDLVLVEGD